VGEETSASQFQATVQNAADGPITFLLRLGLLAPYALANRVSDIWDENDSSIHTDVELILPSSQVQQFDRVATADCTGKTASAIM
jgi:hypothetical protein